MIELNNARRRLLVVGLLGDEDDTSSKSAICKNDIGMVIIRASEFALAMFWTSCSSEGFAVKSLNRRMRRKQQFSRQKPEARVRPAEGSRLFAL